MDNLNSNTQIPDASQFTTYEELLEATAQCAHVNFIQADILQWRAYQLDSFFEDFQCLKHSESFAYSSRPLTLCFLRIMGMDCFWSFPIKIEWRVEKR